MQELPTDGNLGASQPAIYQSSPRRFPWGCLVGGCLTAVLLMMAGAVGTGLAGYWFYKGQLARYTSEEAKELPTVDMSQEEIAAIEKRVEAFQAKLDEGKTPEQLVLTADDINALISSNENLRGKVFVQIGEGEITADVSIPTDSLPGGKGRYFNGSVTAEVELKGGVLIVTVAEAEVNGNSVPEPIMQGMRQENLAKELYKDPEVAKNLARFESIVVDEDRIVLTVREQEHAETVEPAPGDEVTLQTEMSLDEESGGVADAPPKPAAEDLESETDQSSPDRLSSPF